MEPERSREAVLILAMAARLVERSLGDLTLPQLRVLALVARAPERAGRIATEAGVSRPSLTGVLDGLVGRDLVRRTHVDGDRRGVRLEITTEGRGALDRATDDAATALAQVTAQLPAYDRHLVEDGIGALGQALAMRPRPTRDAQAPSPR